MKKFTVKASRDAKRHIKSSTVLAYTKEDDSPEYWEEYFQGISQEFTSENTSINAKKLPALFNKISFNPGTINVDYGGGRFDNVAEYLTQYDVINLVYDPFNRTSEHNKAVIDTIREAGGADSATLANVLNVIKEPEVRLDVLRKMKKMLKPNAPVYIQIYEGNGSGEGSPTSSGYQTNKKAKDFEDEIKQYFPDAKRKGNLWYATNSGGVTASTRIKASSDISNGLVFI